MPEYWVTGEVVTVVTSTVGDTATIVGYPRHTVNRLVEASSKAGAADIALGDYEVPFFEDLAEWIKGPFVKAYLERDRLLKLSEDVAPTLPGMEDIRDG